MALVMGLLWRFLRFFFPFFFLIFILVLPLPPPPSLSLSLSSPPPPPPPSPLQILSVFKVVPLQATFDQINEFHAKSAGKGAEAREKWFARIFGIMAILRSSRVEETFGEGKGGEKKSSLLVTLVRLFPLLLSIPSIPIFSPLFSVLSSLFPSLPTSSPPALLSPFPSLFP